ncbi:uncharacterized protein LOC100678775 [Nasonia vitripennis]|uniref:Regulatory protein zeste n=1 Tax=Nasonia vitripennis TaxID=7425 RepID=A0A7M7GCL7_NASVI|nr:uncharacterized protein LOC100678775 [Nasonia vitripennis]
MISKVTNDQKECLLSYMEDHSGFAAHKFMGLDGTAQRHEQWNKLKVMLDRLGPEKSIESWSKLDTIMQKKNKKNRKTGNHADQIIEINCQHERVLKIVGILSWE